MNKGAWWVDSPTAVSTLAAAGFTIHLIPYLSDTQIDATLAAVPPFAYAVVLLTGATPAESEQQVLRLAGRLFYGYVVADEPNCGGTLLPIETQIAYYNRVKEIDASKRVLASYHLGQDGPSFPAYVVPSPGIAWDVAFLNCYPAAWGNTNEQAADILRSATAGARCFFPAHAPLVPIQQACGLTSLARGARPIPGLFQAQQDIWRASGLITADSIVYYGWGTNPEDWNLQTPGVLEEARGVV